MYADAFGGNTTTFINNEIEYLSQNNDLTFACIIKKESKFFDFKNVKKLNYKDSFFQRILKKFDISLNYKNKIFAEELNDLINAIKPDVIHCHFGKEALKIIDNLNDKSIPIVIHFHGYDASSALKSSSYVERLKEVLSQDRIYPIFVAKYLRQNLLNLNIPVKNETILHCGINLEKFHPEDNRKKRKEKIFLQVSSLVEKKGHEYTIQAFSKFLDAQSEKKYRLILTGDGPRKALLEQLVSDLDIKDKVDFIGYVTPDKAIELMQNADVFLHHSITAINGDQEGIPTALMEAMAMKLPVVSTIHSGIPELVSDRVNGYLVKEKDVNTYSLKLAEALKIDRISQNRITIEEDFELIKHNQKLFQLYETVTGK